MKKPVLSYVISSDRHTVISFKQFSSIQEAFEQIRRHARRGVRQLLITSLASFRDPDQTIFDAKDTDQLVTLEKMYEFPDAVRFVVALHEIRKVGESVDQRPSKRIVVIFLKTGESFSEQDFASLET